jgi:O-antigen biosynthesis protein WbqV
MSGDMILRRPALEFDLASARSFFRARSVLVTGGGGSIGLELCAQLAELGCARIGVLDHFDHGLITACEALKERFAKLKVVELLCDIRDRDRLSFTIARMRPDVVINAAALKHVHLGERHPVECVRTNLVAVRNVLEAAAEAGAGCFVQVSTDKAADPVCVMGASKRLAELYLWGFARERADAPKLKAVRFGNVFGSQGSVVPRFQRQIEAGRPLEVTHPDMKRFFMTAREASQFVAQVAAHEGPAVSSYCRELGEPVRILDIAEDMLRRAGSKAGVVVTGLREGEKLGEVLYDEWESVRPSDLGACCEIAPLRGRGLSSAELAALEAFIRTHDGAPVIQRLFALLDDCLGRREAQAG